MRDLLGVGTLLKEQKVIDRRQRKADAASAVNGSHSPANLPNPPSATESPAPAAKQEMPT
jgi:hypothetical protein